MIEQQELVRDDNLGSLEWAHGTGSNGPGGQAPATLRSTAVSTSQGKGDCTTNQTDQNASMVRRAA